MCAAFEGEEARDPAGRSARQDPLTDVAEARGPRDQRPPVHAHGPGQRARRQGRLKRTITDGLRPGAGLGFARSWPMRYRRGARASWPGGRRMRSPRNTYSHSGAARARRDRPRGITTPACTLDNLYSPWFPLR